MAAGTLTQVLKLVTAADTRGTEALIDSLDRTDKAADKTEGSLGKLHKAGTLIGTAVAGGIAAELVVATKTAADFEQSVNAVGAATGATTAEVAALRKEALQVGKDTSLSASQSVTAFGELAKAGVAVSDIVGGVGRTTVQLAEATGAPVAQMATLLADTRSIWKLSTEGVTEAADTMARAAVASTIDIGDMQAAISNVGPVAADLGLSVRDTSVALGILGNNGIKGAEAGTALRGVLLRLTAPTDKAAAAMADLGIEVFDAQGKMRPLPAILGDFDKALAPLTQEDRTGIMKTIFDSYTITAGNVLIGDATNKFDAFNKALDSSPGVADQAKRRLDGLNGTIEQLKGSFETIQINLGTLLLPTISDLAKHALDLTNKLIAFMDAVEAGDPKAVAAADALKLVGAALAALFVVNALVGPVTTLYNTLATLYKLGSKTISVAVDLGETAYLKFLEFQDKWNSLVDKTVSLTMKGVEEAQKRVDQLAQTIQQKLTDKVFSVTGKVAADELEKEGAKAGTSAANGIASGLGSSLAVAVAPKIAASGVGTAISGGIGSAMSAVSGGLSAVLASPVGLIIVGVIAALVAGFLIFKNRDKVKDFLWPLFGGIRDFFTETIPETVAGLPELGGQVAGWLLGQFANAREWVGNALAPIGGAVGDFFTNRLPSFFTDTIPAALAKVPDLLADGAKALAFGLGVALALVLVAIPVETYRAAKLGAEKLLDGLGWAADNLGPVLGKIVERVADLGADLAGAAADAFGAAWEWISGPDGPASWPGKIYDLLVEIGVKENDLGALLKDGMAAAWAAAWEFITTELPTWPGKVWDFLLAIATRAGDLGGELSDVTARAWAAAWEWISTELPTWPGKVWDFIVKIATKLAELDTELVRVTGDAWAAAWKWITTELPTWPGKVWDFIVKIPDRLADLGALLRTAASDAWGAAWDWISTNLPTWPGKIADFFRGLPGALGGAARAAVNAFVGAFGGLGGFLARPINFGIDVINSLIDGVNSVLDALHLGIKIGHIPNIGGGGSAPLPFPEVPAPSGEGFIGLAAGGKVDRPGIRQVGEDAPTWPEFVIPTNPRYRARARQLAAEALASLDSDSRPHDAMPIGFGIPNPITLVGDAIGGIGDWVREGAASLVERLVSKIAGFLPDDSTMGGKLARGAFGLIKDKIIGVIQGGLDKAEAEGRNMRPPLAGYSITQGFGENPQIYGAGGHTGIDMVAGHLASILAAASGAVQHAGWLDPRGTGGYGNAVMLGHATGIQSLYGHMSEILASGGQNVLGGNAIGRTGWTGFVIPQGPGGEHLHFEIRSGGVPVNPRNFVSLAVGGVISRHRLLVDPVTGQVTGEVAEGDNPEAVIPLAGTAGHGIGGDPGISNLTVNAQKVEIGSGAFAAKTSSTSASLDDGRVQVEDTVNLLGVFGLGLQKVTDDMGTFLSLFKDPALELVTPGQGAQQIQELLGRLPEANAKAFVDAISRAAAWANAANNPNSAFAVGSANYNAILAAVRAANPNASEADLRMLVNEATLTAADTTNAITASAAATQAAADATTSAVAGLTAEQSATFGAYQRLIDANNAELAELDRNMAITRDLVAGGGPLADWARGMLEQQQAREDALLSANAEAGQAQLEAANGNLAAAQAHLAAADTSAAAAGRLKDTADESGITTKTEKETAGKNSETAEVVKAAADETAEAADTTASAGDDFSGSVDDFGNVVDDMGNIVAAASDATDLQLEDRRRQWEKDHPGEGAAPFASGTILRRPFYMFDKASGRLIGEGGEQGAEWLVNQGMMTNLLTRPGGAAGAGYVDRSVSYYYMTPDPRALQRIQQENYHTRRLTEQNRRRG